MNEGHSRRVGWHLASVDIMQVCLASTSPARLMLLRQCGIEPLTIPSDVDEDAAVAVAEEEAGRPLTPEEHVLLLAQAKAAAVAAGLASSHPDFSGIVIGGDSMFELDGQIFGKPYTAEAATERWLHMRGQSGVLHSGHSVLLVQQGAVVDAADDVADATVHFVADISDDEIAAYVATGEPLQVAGAFTVDSLGAPFIDRVEGDPSTVVGMSLSTIRALTTRLGISWPSLWNRL